MKKVDTTKDSKKNLENLKKSRRKVKIQEAKLKLRMEIARRWMQVPPNIT